MKIFVCEFITGGGLYREVLPASLAQEGALMRDALLRDLSELPEVVTVVACDNRLEAPLHANQLISIQLQDDVWAIWAQCIADADAVWLIAPETGGVLARLTALVNEYGKTLLGCALPAVLVASSKWATYRSLKVAGINTINTYQYADWTHDHTHSWVAKMDDGAGCEDSAYFEDVQLLDVWMQTRQATHVIQPYQAGVAASLSMLCKQGEAWLLSCNLQKIEINQGGFNYSGSVLNGIAERWSVFELIAKQVASAIPDLAGYVGVDLIVDTQSDNIYVLEVNPRLTTSYVGLHQAINYNPARLVLNLLAADLFATDLLGADLFYNDAFVMPAISRQKVEVSLHA